MTLQVTKVLNGQVKLVAELGDTQQAEAFQIAAEAADWGSQEAVIYVEYIRENSGAYPWRVKLTDW